MVAASPVISLYRPWVQQSLLSSGAVCREGLALGPVPGETVVEQLRRWVDRFVQDHRTLGTASPANFFAWLLCHPELDAKLRPVVGQLLGLELVVQESEVHREALAQFHTWNLRCRKWLASQPPSHLALVLNPVVVSLSWSEPEKPDQSQRWLFFAGHGRVIALRPRRETWELLALLLQSPRNGLSLDHWWRNTPPCAHHQALKLLADMIRLGLVALVPRELIGA